jgi:hypothetical protein
MHFPKVINNLQSLPFIFEFENTNLFIGRSRGILGQRIAPILGWTALKMGIVKELKLFGRR